MIYTVYKHTCPNEKIYIGITSRTIKERWRTNGKGYKKNKHFYSAINKYGWENIKHEILFNNLTKEEACKKEIELIAFYKSNERKYGYNSSLGGEINNGFKVSEERKKQISNTLKEKYKTIKNSNYGKHLSNETKKKLSIANKGKKVSEETKEKISKTNKGKLKSDQFKILVREREQSKVDNILQIDFKGNIINIFNSIHTAARMTNTTATKICAVCKGRRKTANGYIWLYEKDKYLIEDRIKQVNKSLKYFNKERLPNENSN